MNDIDSRPVSDSALIVLQCGPHWVAEAHDTPCPEGGLRLSSRVGESGLFWAEKRGDAYRFTSVHSGRFLVARDEALHLDDAPAGVSDFDLPLQAWDDGAASSDADSPVTLAPTRTGLKALALPPSAFWDDKEHAKLIEDAFATILRFSDKADAGFLKRLWDNATFRRRLLDGLRDADYKNPYYNHSLYSSHFFDPDTKCNYLGRTGTTAFTEACLYSNRAAESAQVIRDLTGQGIGDARLDGACDKCGYDLGLALHYVSDLTQPMHAGNFINKPFPVGDWRHRGFETYADANGPRYRRDPNGVRWDEIDPGMRTMEEHIYGIAVFSKEVFNRLMRPALQLKVRGLGDYVETWGAEADPILAATVGPGQIGITRYLLLWSRLNPVAVVAQTLPTVRSSYSPKFVRFRDRTYAVYADYDDSGRIKLQPVDREKPDGEIRTNFVSYETPGAAVVRGLLVVVYMDDTGRLCALRTLDLVRWEQERLRDTIKGAPSAAECDGKLVVVYRYDGGMFGADELRFTTYDPLGSFWGPAERMTGKASDEPPAVTTFAGKVYAAWTGLHKGQSIFYASYSPGTGWSDQSTFSRYPVISDKSPALAVVDGVLHLFFRDGKHAVQYVKSADGANWSGIGTIAGSKSDRGLTASSFGDRAVVGWNSDWKAHYAYFGRTALAIDIPDGAAIRAAGTIPIYVACGFAKYHIPDPAIFKKLGYKDADIRDYPPAIVGAMSAIPLDGTIVRELSKPEIHLIVGGARMHVADGAELAAISGGRKTVVVPDGALGALPGTPKADTVIKVMPEPPVRPESIPPRNWKVYNIVDLSGVLKRKEISLYDMGENEVEALLETARLAPRVANRIPS